jgi:hypothetical protein
VRLAELAGAAIAFAAIKRLTDAKPTAVTPTKPIIPQGFTLGPAAPSMDIKPLIPEGAFKITPEQIVAFKPQTPEQQAFTRERILTPNGTPEQAKMLIESGAIKQGKIKKFGTGVSLADLLKRQVPRK